MGSRFQARPFCARMLPLLNQPLAFDELSGLRPLWFSPVQQQLTKTCKAPGLCSAQGDTARPHTTGTQSQERQVWGWVGGRASVERREEVGIVVLGLQGWHHHQTGSSSP